MNDTVRPEVSKKNDYWIPKHRYYELKHFCQQYPEWKAARAWIDGYSGSQQLGDRVQTSVLADQTADSAQLRIVYSNRIEMIDKAAEQADPDLAYFIDSTKADATKLAALEQRLYGTPAVVGDNAVDAVPAYLPLPAEIAEIFSTQQSDPTPGEEETQQPAG